MDLQFLYQNGPIGKFICIENSLWISANDDDDHNSCQREDNNLTLTLIQRHTEDKQQKLISQS